MGNEAIFILVPKERAKNSIEARKLVLLTIQEKRLGIPGRYPFIGGIFSGLFSEICVIERPHLPYYNNELRKIIRDKFLNYYIPWMEKRPILADLHLLVIKKDIPELEKYSDSDILDALRLELYPKVAIYLEIGPKNGKVSTLFRFKTEISDTTFKPVPPPPEKWINGRYEFAELGYEDDAVLVNECIYQQIIDKEIEKILNIEDIEEKNIIIATAKRIKITQYNTIGKKWIVLLNAHTEGELGSYKK